MLEMYNFDMMDTVQQIAFSFNYSAKRLLALQAELELDDDEQAGVNRTKLQLLCETRRSSHANALYIFKSTFTVGATVMEYLEEYGDGKARHCLSIKAFDLIIALVVIDTLQSLHLHPPFAKDRGQVVVMSPWPEGHSFYVLFRLKNAPICKLVQFFKWTLDPLLDLYFHVYLYIATSLTVEPSTPHT